MLCFLLLSSHNLAGYCQTKQDDTSGGAQAPPAAQTELSQQGRSLKVDIFGPLKGLASNVADTARDNQYATVLNNLRMLKRGVWSSRGTGATKHRASQFNSGGRFFCIIPFNDSTGAQRLVFQCGDKLYTYVESTTTETQKYTGLSTSAQSDLKAYDYNLVTYVNGDINPLKWDGVAANNFTALSGWPVSMTGPPPSFGTLTFEKPKYQEAFAGRLVTAGFSAYPSSVLMSYFGYPGAYTQDSSATSAGYITFPSSLGKITGLHTMRLDSASNESVLIVGCERGMGLITGNSADNFEGLELTREFGLMSNRCFVQIGNDLYFLASDGIRRISSSIGSSTVGLAPMTYGLQDIVNRINKDQAEKAFCLPHPRTQEATWYFPIDSGTEADHGIVLNYNVDSRNGTVTSTDNPAFSTVSDLTLTCGADVGSNCYVGTTNGYLKLLYSGDDFDGTAIPWSYVSPFIGANSPAQEASLKKMLILTEGGRQKFDATCYTLTTMGDGNTKWIVRDSKSFDVTGSTVSDIRTWQSGTTASYTKLFDVFSKGSGRYWVLKLSGDAANEHIDLVGVQSILTVGGWRQ